MPNRREILQGGAALSAVAVTGGSFLELARSGTPAHQDVGLQHYYRILFDKDIAVSRAFAAEAERLGGAVHGLKQGDVRDFWYQELYPQWQKGNPVTIAGLTTEDAAFDIELLGRDADQWRVFRGDHLVAADEGTSHRLAGLEWMVAEAQRVLDTGTAWPLHLARVFGALSLTANAAGKARHELVAAPAPGTSHAAVHLVSWMIAPRSVLGA